MSKKAQAEVGIVALVGVIIVLLFLAPIMLKIVSTTIGSTSDAINSTSPDAANTMNYLSGTFVTFWDYLILISFLVSMLMLLISSFFIDTHPVFLVFYIMIAFLVVIFAPEILQSVNAVWDNSGMTMHDGTMVSLALPLTDFLRGNFGAVILGVIVLSGIIMYAKIKYFSNE